MKTYEKKSKAIAEAKRLTKSTGEPHDVYKTLSGYDVMPASSWRGAMGVCVYES